MKLQLEDIPHYTREDYEQWEGDWELICGVPYAMTPRPIDEHQRISGNLYYEIRRQLADVDGAWVGYESEWRVSHDTTVVPDLMIGEGRIRGDYLDFAPTVVIEILSPRTEQKDRSIKWRLYESEGVPTYLLVDPAVRTMESYHLVHGRYGLADHPTPFVVSGIPVHLDLARLFDR